MTTIESLKTLAEALDESWNDFGLDWDEAEELVEACRGIPAKVIANLPKVQAIIAYASSCDDWDSNEVGNWPAAILDEIEALEKA